LASWNFHAHRFPRIFPLHYITLVAVFLLNIESIRVNAHDNMMANFRNLAGESRPSGE